MTLLAFVELRLSNFEMEKRLTGHKVNKAIYFRTLVRLSLSLWDLAFGTTQVPSIIPGVRPLRPSLAPWVDL